MRWPTRPIDVYASAAPPANSTRPDGHEQRAARGHVEHGQEDPEVEERAAEVVRLDDDQHGRAEEQEQWPEILEPRLREHLALLPEVRGEEDDEEHLRELAGLEAERPDVDPQAGAVHGAPDDGQCWQHEQDHRRDARRRTCSSRPCGNRVGRRAAPRSWRSRRRRSTSSGAVRRWGRCDRSRSRRSPSAARRAAGGTGLRRAR